MLRKLFFCLLFLTAGAQAARHDFLGLLAQEGFMELKNPHVTRKTYDAIYQNFEDVISRTQQDPHFAEALLKLEKQFQETEDSKAFCGAPTGSYRDCTSKDHKLDSKKYFQFSSEFCSFVRTVHSDVLVQYPLLETFLSRLERVDTAAKTLFKELFVPAQATYPQVIQAMYGNRGDNLTIITKVLSYDPSAEELGTSPHYDKSGFTIILDNDDIINDKLVIAPYHAPFDFKKLRAPQRQFDGSAECSSALFIAGSLLKHQGFDINPTPHAVLPVTSEENRHSLIAFALLPHIDMTGAQTTIVEKAELMKNPTSGTHYSAAKVLLAHPQEASVLLANRQIDQTFGYEVPGGRVDINFATKRTETFEQCALREAYEELGLKLQLKDYLGSYAFFWESQPDTCTHCVVFLAEPAPGTDLKTLKNIGDTDGHPVRPEWVSTQDILENKLQVRSNHGGLWPILHKAALMVHQRV